MLPQRCLDELEVFDQVSRLSADPFQHNRRLSETNYIDLKTLKGGQSRETCSVDQSQLVQHLSTLDDICSSSDGLSLNLLQHSDNIRCDNPFQNDQLPLWQASQKKGTNSAAGGRSGPSRVKSNHSSSNLSSPDNNNYSGQQQAYSYKSLNETPTSPELANHRGLSASPPGTPQHSPEIIQVKDDIPKSCDISSSRPLFPYKKPGLSDIERQKIQQKIDAEIAEKREQRLTVMKKSSIDRPDDDNFEMESAIVTVMDEVAAGQNISSVTRDLKKEESDEDEYGDEDENEDIIDDDINRTENFKKLAGKVVEIDLKRNDFGFGLALAGHSNRNRMGTFICGIHPQGAAFENGQLKVGDELLKVISFPSHKKNSFQAP